MSSSIFGIVLIAPFAPNDAHSLELINHMQVEGDCKVSVPFAHKHFGSAMERECECVGRKAFGGLGPTSNGSYLPRCCPSVTIWPIAPVVDGRTDLLQGLAAGL